MKLFQVFLFLLLLAVYGAGNAQPRAEVAEWKKSFGTVKQGDPVKFEYAVLNKGDQPLIFEDYEVACTCTSAQLPAQPVLPGKTAIITVSFSTASAIGRQDRVVAVYSNDPKAPLKLRFRGSVDQK